MTPLPFTGRRMTAKYLAKIQTVWWLISQNPAITHRGIVALTGYQHRTVECVLKVLKRFHYVERTQKFARGWRVNVALVEAR